MAKAIPCKAPQIMKRKLAPCHNPPNNMVVIKFTLVYMVFSFSLENKKVKINIIVDATAKINGMLLVVENEIPQIIVPTKNKLGNKNPTKVP